MIEVWLRSNRRVLLVAMAPASLLGGIGLTALSLDLSLPWRILAWLALAVSLLLIVGLLLQLIRPRVAFRQNHVLFYLKAGSPIEVPTHVVEAFFLGQGPAKLPGSPGKPTETVNLIARLSQRAAEWERREIKPALGRWCDGYVTIHGTWCEPLNGDVVRRLNRRLAEVSRMEQGAAKEGSAKI